MTLRDINVNFDRKMIKLKKKYGLSAAVFFHQSGTHERQTRIIDFLPVLPLGRVFFTFMSPKTNHSEVLTADPDLGLISFRFTLQRLITGIG
jgi:hypothetical protein